MTRKVAILLTTDVYSYDEYNDDHRSIVNSITEWEEISNEDFQVLQSASYRKGFKIVEQPANPSDFIAKTVSEEIARAKEEAIKLEAEKVARAEAAKLKKYKKDLKDKESKLALLKKLQAELGEEAK
jgi:NADH dehydrogenase/NADH:ubiquinone oxidoreductase subunit G